MSDVNTWDKVLESIASLTAFAREQEEARAAERKERAEWEEKWAKEQAKEQAARAKEQAARAKEQEARAKEWEEKWEKRVEEWEKGYREREIERKAAAESLQYLKDSIGRFGNRLGDMVELLVVPGLRPEANKLGHKFEHSTTEKIIKDGDGVKIMEIDVLLYNGTEALAVEVKTRIGTGMIDGFVQKLEKARDHGVRPAEIRGKAVYAGIAAAIIDEPAARHALERGLYVIEILEQGDVLEIRAPEMAAQF